MTDPCESCLRWSECNGVDIDTCPLWRDKLAAQYEDIDDRDTLMARAIEVLRAIDQEPLPPMEITAMDLSYLEDKTESGLLEDD